MSLKKKKGSVYIITYDCPKDDCKGQMLDTGNVWASVPVLFEHKCNVCGHSMHLDNRYPHQEAIADDEDVKDELSDK